MRARRASIAPVVLATFLAANGLAGAAFAQQAAATSAPKKGWTKATKAPEPDPLPAPAARLWIVAPSPSSPWTLRVDNEGSVPLRIPADVRLLRFEIAPLEDAVDEAPKKKWTKKKAKKPFICALPKSMRSDSFPEPRGLLLAPGQSYIDTFDPRLLCFGKDAAAALVGGATVQTRFGWDVPKKPTKKPLQPPFAVEGTEFPAELSSLRELTAPTMVMSYEKPIATPAPVVLPTVKPEVPADSTKDQAAKDSSAKALPPKDEDDEPPAPAIVDENAPRLELTAAPFVDAGAPDRIALTVKVTNVGQRPTLAVLRPRMLAFRIDGPDGALRCNAAPPANAIPREMFHTMKPGGSVSMTVLLAEQCPMHTFRRSGLYRVIPTLHAGESGAELGLAAYTGVSKAKAPTLVRVQTAGEPFHANAPKAVPTPKPAATPDGA